MARENPPDDDLEAVIRALRDEIARLKDELARLRGERDERPPHYL
jgi:uncharacterized small protein (DUF1192 family)